MNAPLLKRFKRAYADAVATKQEQFEFQGQTYLTEYAKHLIEYLTERPK